MVCVGKFPYTATGYRVGGAVPSAMWLLFWNFPRIFVCLAYATRGTVAPRGGWNPCPRRSARSPPFLASDASRHVWHPFSSPPPKTRAARREPFFLAPTDCRRAYPGSEPAKRAARRVRGPLGAVPWRGACPFAGNPAAEPMRPRAPKNTCRPARDAPAPRRAGRIFLRAGAHLSCETVAHGGASAPRGGNAASGDPPSKGRPCGKRDQGGGADASR